MGCLPPGVNTTKTIYHIYHMYHNVVSKPFSGYGDMILMIDDRAWR